MSKLSLEFATTSDLEWINKKYDEVNFLHSSLTDEKIVVAKEENLSLGLGRIQELSAGVWELGGIYTFPEARGKGVARQIVEKLLTVPKELDEIYCLPFANLLDFYLSFGFKKTSPTQDTDAKILKKLDWCNSGVYENNVELLLLKQQAR